jgi:hypothetical protein
MFASAVLVLVGTVATLAVLLGAIFFLFVLKRTAPPASTRRSADSPLVLSNAPESCNWFNAVARCCAAYAFGGAATRDDNVHTLASRRFTTRNVRLRSVHLGSSDACWPDIHGIRATTTSSGGVELAAYVRFDGSAFSVQLQTELPLLHGFLAMRIPPEVLLARVEMEIKNVNFSFHAKAVLEPGGVVYVWMDMPPQWTADISSVIGNRVSAIDGGDKFNEIARCQVNRAVQRFVYPNALKGEFRIHPPYVEWSRTKVSG